MGFSVSCPGFVAGDGMYQRMVEEGLVSNRLIGTTTTERIANLVVAAVRLGPLSGATALFGRTAASRGRAE